MPFADRRWQVPVPVVAVCALLAALSVFLVNGIGLIYFDTGGYLSAGDQVLSALGFGGTPQQVAQLAPSVPREPDGAAKVVVGNRSALYGVVLSFATRMGWLDLVVLLNLAALWFAVWLTVCAVQRAQGDDGSALRMTSILILAGCAGSLPFYVAFLMPDILAPILILVLALLSAYAKDMRRYEIAAAVVLAVLSVLSHPSHLLLAALLVPAAALLSPASRGYRVRMFAGLLVLVVGLGVTERVAFSRIAEAIDGSKVIILPFLTARLIDDGPGRTYLTDHCPNQGQPACPLLESLTRPGAGDGRFDAPVILFSADPSYGSYRLLASADQQRIANDQIRFALAVVADRPFSVLMAICRNVGDQLLRSSIAMTIPTPEIIAFLVVEGGQIGPRYGKGRLTGPEQVWMTPLIRTHAAIYLLSTIGIAALMLWPGLPRRNRHLALMVLFGIFANAFVCGAISEPADRYGGRTMFLLPMLLALMLPTASAQQSDPPLKSAPGKVLPYW